ncbi:MAG: gluconokinase [Planctomycetota bacterium]
MDQRPLQPVSWIVMGVSGSGKSTVGRALAERLAADFFDADDFHPPANVEKMRRGQPLEDADRGPWLEALNGLLRERTGVVLACSALKRAYRERLRAGVTPGLRFLHLDADFETLRRRMAERDHFMPVSLLRSQLDTLETPGPDEALVLPADRPVDQLVDAAVATLSGGGDAASSRR